MLSPLRLIQALGLTGLVMGCGSTIIVAGAPTDAAPAIDAVAVVDAGLVVDRGVTPTVDLGVTPLRDGGPPVIRDAGVTPTACVLPDGTVCALGATCASADRCSRCRCTARGLECEATPCRDGGPVIPPTTPCRANSDCDDTELCAGP